jgi:hypothetical protein
LGDGDQEDCGSRPTWAKKTTRSHFNQWLSEVAGISAIHGNKKLHREEVQANLGIKGDFISKITNTQGW